MNNIEIISIISPFIAAFLTAYLTYRFTLNSKRIEILYENKIPAFKIIASKIIAFQNFCDGRVAYFEGNEYSPFYEEEAGTLVHRIEIANSFFVNIIFLSENSRLLLNKLLSNMSGLCNIEAQLVGSDDNEINPENEYKRISLMSDSIVQVLYKELNLIEP